MKKSMILFLKGILSIIVVLVFCITVSGCQKKENAMEKAVMKVDEGIGEVKDASKEIAEEIEHNLKQDNN